MAHVTTYICDQCKKPVPELNGPLLIEITSPVHQVQFEGEVCSLDCATQWVADQLKHF